MGKGVEWVRDVSRQVGYDVGVVRTLYREYKNYKMDGDLW